MRISPTVRNIPSYSVAQKGNKIKVTITQYPAHFKVLQRDKVVQAITQNLVEAGVIALPEVGQVQLNLNTMDWKDLQANLIESEALRSAGPAVVKELT